MGTHVKENIKFYIVLAAFLISVGLHFKSWGADLNQIDTNKVEITETKKYNRIEHAKILIEIKELSDKIASNSGKMEAVKAQNDLIIKLIQKNL